MHYASETMETTSSDSLSAWPRDVLIVEDDPIIALVFEDTILGLGVQEVVSIVSLA